MHDSSSVLHTGQDEGSVAPQSAADTLASALGNVETEQRDDSHEPSQQPDVAAEGGGAAQPQYDWDSDDNPYKQRLRGIQGRLQQEIEEKRAYEHRLMEMERQQVYHQAQQMHPQDRDAYIQNWQQQAAVRQRERDLQFREQSMEAAARNYWVRDLSIRYGVPAEKLSRFNDPDSMEVYAQDLAEERKQRTKASRQAQGNDRFEGESPGRARPDKAPETYEEARRMFVALAERDAARQ